MKTEKGYSLIVLVLTIVVMVILIAIALKPSTQVLDDTEEAKKQAEAAIDDDKIKEIINYETAGIPDLIDVEIVYKRIPLTEDIAVSNKGITYGTGWTLYIAERDIEKIEEKTGQRNYYKPYNDITRSYVVDTDTGHFVRLEVDWTFATIISTP